MADKKINTFLIIGGIILVLLIIAIIYFQNKTPSLGDNEILIKDYSYTYKKDTSSHQIRGIWETISFNYNGTSFNIKSEQTHAGPSYGQTSFTYDFRDDAPINLYSEGGELPANCKGEINTPDNFYSYGIVNMSCTSQIKLSILDKNLFDSCLNSNECDLIYGRDIKISQ